MDQQTIFTKKIYQILQNKANNSKFVTEDQYNYLINKMKILRENGPCSNDKKDYYLLKQYDIQRERDTFLLIKKKDGKIVVHVDKLFEVIKTAHSATGHGGRQVTTKLLNEKYANISQEIVTLFIEGCENCQLKRNKIKKGLVVKPIISNHFNSRCQIDLIDLQSRPDDNYKFILVYQDHLTKYIQLKALKTKTAKEVAYNLIDIFTQFGSPCILQSDNGREFANQVRKITYLSFKILISWNIYLCYK